MFSYLSTTKAFAFAVDKILSLNAFVSSFVPLAIFITPLPAVHIYRFPWLSNLAFLIDTLSLSAERSYPGFSIFPVLMSKLMMPCRPTISVVYLSFLRKHTVPPKGMWNFCFFIVL